MNGNKKVILASRSPRRKELLEKCGIEFSCMPADIDETLNQTLPLHQAVEDLSYRKAAAILKDHMDAIVIGSDTIVTLDGVVLGKPKDRHDACRMLQKLSGKEHQVITGLCMISRDRCFRTSSIAKVTFAGLDQEEIEAYVNSGECDDKAGAYAIQGIGGKFITHIDGDYYAIMGLPLNTVYEELKNISLY